MTLTPDISLQDPFDGLDEALAPPRRRPDPVRRVPAGLQAARGAARPVLRSGPHRRSDRAHQLRPVQRVLRGSGGEEAAEPLPARLGGAVVRHRGLQPGLQVLPELGHLQIARDRHPFRTGDSRGPGPGGRRNRLPQRRFHLQRPDHLLGVRRRRRRCLPRAGHQGDLGDRGLTCARSRARSSIGISTPPTSI